MYGITGLMPCAFSFASSDAVGLVTGQFPGPAESLLSLADEDGDGLIDQFFGLRRLVDLPRGDFDDKGCSLAVSDHVELRSKPASRAAQCMIGRFFGVSLETFLSAPAAAPVGVESRLGLGLAVHIFIFEMPESA